MEQREGGPIEVDFDREGSFLTAPALDSVRG